MTILRVNQVTKKFGSFTALDGIDLEVGQGEIYGFIGPNGAGKTTTIRILLGILQATSGTATIFGQDAWRDAVEIHKRIAYAREVNYGLILPEASNRSLCQLRGAVARPRKLISVRPNLQKMALIPSNRQKVALIAAFYLNACISWMNQPRPNP